MWKYFYGVQRKRLRLMTYYLRLMLAWFCKPFVQKLIDHKNVKIKGT